MTISVEALVDSAWLSRPAPEVAPDLIGCVLVRQWTDGRIQRSTIVETEAYQQDEPACHAYQRHTQRNTVMFGPAGFCYVYMIYGIHHCLNVVTDREGFASAVLIRALELNPQHPRQAAGPGKLCQVLEIDRSLNGIPLQPQPLPHQALWLEHRPDHLQNSLELKSLCQTTRIGISQGTELLWRWYLSSSAAVSKR